MRWQFWGILVLAFLIRFPGIWWGNMHGPAPDFFEPDEHQHLSLAIGTLQRLDPGLFADFSPNRLNTQGFAVQTGWLAFPFVRWGGADYRWLCVMGRLLSLAYALGLVVVVWKIGQILWDDARKSAHAALLLALFDLQATYSHYAVPEIFHTFWAWMALYILMCAFVKKGSRRGVFSWGWVSAGALASAMSLAGKYDFIPAMLWVCAIAWRFRRKPGRAAGWILGFLWMCFLFFEVGIGFQNETLRASFEWLFAENRDLIARDRHWVYNLFLYLIAIAVGTSLPVFVFFVKGCGHEWRRGMSAYFSGSAALFWLFVFVAMEGLVLWNLDAPFVRRANIFMPFVALMATAGLHEMRSPKKRKAAIWVTILYTYALTAVSQFNFIKDPRYAARDYLREKMPAGATIYYDPYARMKNTPPGTDAYDQADFVVLHESGYRRYWKSFTTPFGVPDCCEEVYHCGSEKICLWTQEILKGSPKYELVVRYVPLEVFPERLLYKTLFGTYETFMGEVRIYRKK